MDAKTGKTMPVELWLCPTPGCTNYYGTSGSGDLAAEWTGPKIEDRGALEASSGSRYRHSRGECPDCRQRGARVMRQRVTVQVSFAVEPSVPPELPGSTGVVHEL